MNPALEEYVSDGSWEAALKKTVGPSGYYAARPAGVGSTPEPRTAAAESMGGVDAGGTSRPSCPRTHPSTPSTATR